MEEKPDVTYSDVGGCKEQIEKLREVVETPLLHVSAHKCSGWIVIVFFLVINSSSDSDDVFIQPSHSCSLCNYVCL